MSPEIVPLAMHEQFANPEQQRETASFGMWVFIVSEMMLFGGLFMAFTVYRMYYPQPFIQGSAGMDILLGSINTAVLICSSFTMALAVYSAQAGSRRLVTLFLVLTMLIGALFLVIKFTEYYKHYLDHKAPGVWFDSAGASGPKIELFYVFYFIMTGLHALHMIVGLGLLAVTLGRTLAGR
ncbi:MAG TPA: cytochrome c oxidase subunit 3, partial [Bryobacteraceae bacterium]|nr:cytochrome c oxidase subunit 3 [Bryobacteraceae bacterium]